MNTIKRAIEVLDIESDAIKGLKKKIDKNFKAAIELLKSTKGRVVVSGMGKTGIIAQKFSATLASTGTPSLFLHSAEAIHGDLGRVIANDVVVIISKSGESQEIKQLLPILKKIGSPVIALTGNARSSLACFSDITLNVVVKKEACPLGLAPTASTTAMLAMCDALSICLLELKGFKQKDFAFFHPGGSLGKSLLLKVGDVMRTGRANPLVGENEAVSSVLLKITRARAGCATVVDKTGRLRGIFTDGDLRRNLKSGQDLTRQRIAAVMTRNPTAISKDRLAAEAMHILEAKKIDEMPVVDKNGKVVGLLDVQDLLEAGVV
jgi:arabinose-5-phosphate isomerase